MPHLPSIRSEEAIKAFERAGFRFHHQRGSHIILRHANGSHLSVPAGRGELKPGTLRALIRRAGLGVEDLLSLGGLTLCKRLVPVHERS